MIHAFLRVGRYLPLRPCHSSLFNTTGLSDDLLRAVDQLGVDSNNGASHEQRLAINASLEGRHVGLFTGTGSGKTLAYLLPIACRLKADEAFQLEHSISTYNEDGTSRPIFRPQPYRPRAIVLAPSRELCVQISNVAKTLAHHCKLKVLGLDGSSSLKSQRQRLESGVDLVVATPGRLQRHRENDHLYLSKVLCLVLDEADTLVSNEFGQEAINIVEALSARDHSEKRSKRRGPYPERCLYTVASATSSSHRLKKLMKTHLPNVAIIKEDLNFNKKGGRGRGGRLGGAPRNEKFLLNPGRDKYATLSSVLKSNEPTLVFCNSVSSCRSAEHYLREQGHSSISYHSDMPSSIRSDNFNTFKHSKVDVMVCTDIAARGLDLRHVRHVINLDFPRTLEWYTHRAGRTARAGDDGRVTSIYIKQEREIVEQIQEQSRNVIGGKYEIGGNKPVVAVEKSNLSNVRNNNRNNIDSNSNRKKKRSKKLNGKLRSGRTPLYSNRVKL
jgi:superfamily II DNA/RNA helicase